MKYIDRKTLLFFMIGFVLGLSVFYGGKFLLSNEQAMVTPLPTPDSTNSPQATPSFVNRKDNLIQVVSPLAFSSISSPVKISGQARGFWFFEASFPVKVVDAKGTVLGQGIAQAKTNWMVQDFVPFALEIDFTEPVTKTGYIVLEKDNPSGLPENAEELRWPVKFSP